jgi:hypothetical protein
MTEHVAWQFKKNTDLIAMESFFFFNCLFVTERDFCDFKLLPPPVDGPFQRSFTPSLEAQTVTVEGFVLNSGSADISSG